MLRGRDDRVVKGYKFLMNGYRLASKYLGENSSQFKTFNKLISMLNR